MTLGLVGETLDKARGHYMAETGKLIQLMRGIYVDAGNAPCQRAISARYRAGPARERREGPAIPCNGSDSGLLISLDLPPVRFHRRHEDAGQIIVLYSPSVRPISGFIVKQNAKNSRKRRKEQRNGFRRLLSQIGFIHHKPSLILRLHRGGLFPAVIHKYLHPLHNALLNLATSTAKTSQTPASGHGH